MKEVIVKRGINGFKYSVYTESGSFIFNAESMKQIRDWYRYELRHGLLRIRKELGKYIGITAIKENSPAHQPTKANVQD